jgi:hypothetical protein
MTSRQSCKPTTAHGHGWGSHVTVMGARCATAPWGVFHPGIGSVTVILGITARQSKAIRASADGWGGRFPQGRHKFFTERSLAV